MKNFMTWCIGLTLLGGAVGCQSTTGKTAGQTMTDTTITTSVQSKLTADKVSNFSRIDVDTERGIVTLNGVVPTSQERDRAERVARAVDGVRGLNNNLQIQSQSPQSMN
jgi:osmotically-inducible protein OsmY